MKRTLTLCLTILALFGPLAAHAQNGGLSPSHAGRFQVWGGYQIPGDSDFKDIYSGLTGFGAAYFQPVTDFGGIEFGAAFQWASGNPVAGSFVQKAEAGFQSVPVTVAFRIDPSPKPVRPYGRIGFVFQWNREGYDVEVADLKIDRSATQWTFGAVAGAGFLSSGRMFNIFSDIQLYWLPGDRIEITEEETRKLDDMNLGGIQIRLGVAF